MRCTLCRKGALVNVIVVHVSARGDDAARKLHSQLIINMANTLGSEARIIVGGDGNTEPHECDTLRSAHSLGFRVASPSCATRWE
eukprot:4170877-Alexandrium_andersonii.AAC.1